MKEGFLHSPIHCDLMIPSHNFCMFDQQDGSKFWVKKYSFTHCFSLVTLSVQLNIWFRDIIFSQCYSCPMKYTICISPSSTLHIWFWMSETNFIKDDNISRSIIELTLDFPHKNYLLINFEPWCVFHFLIQLIFHNKGCTYDHVSLTEQVKVYKIM